MKDEYIISNKKNYTELKLEINEILDIFFYAKIGLIGMDQENNELYKIIDEEAKRICGINCN